MDRNEEQGYIVRQRTLVMSIIVYHIWGTWLVIKPSQFGAEMFSTVSFGIMTSLGILAGEKVLRLLVKFKWGGGDEKSSKTNN